MDKILGKLKVTIELNKDSQNNKSNKKLKYAPISKLAIEIKQDKAIEQSGFYTYQRKFRICVSVKKEISDDIKFIQKVFQVHFKKAPDNTITEDKSRYSFIKTLHPEIFLIKKTLKYRLFLLRRY